MDFTTKVPLQLNLHFHKINAVGSYFVRRFISKHRNQNLYKMHDEPEFMKNVDKLDNNVIKLFGLFQKPLPNLIGSSKICIIEVSMNINIMVPYAHKIELYHSLAIL